MKRLVLLLLLVSLAAGVASAGEPITIGERITIQSEILGEERTILVSTPADLGRTQDRYPVLYMTDGVAHLTHTRGSVDFLARNGLMPQMIIVAVTNTDRNRDLTPTRASMTDDDGSVREFPTSGGASTFLEFFERELFPYIESHYPTEPYRVFAGHSFGGLFALHAAFTRPDMFGAVIAVGPSLRWDNDLPIRQAATFASDRERRDAILFVAMANELEGDPSPNHLDRLEAALAKNHHRGFEWQVMRMPDETHGSVVLRAHYWALRRIFDPWRLPTDPETGRFAGTVSDIERRFADLSKRVGYSVVPAEDAVNQAGYQLLGRDDVEGAIAIFRYNVTLRPGSANVYDSLGEALERAGQLQEAAASYSRAVENAVSIGDDRLEIFTENRDRAQALLADTGTG